MKLLTLCFVIGTFLSTSMAADDAAGAAGKPPNGSVQQADRDRLKVTIYPLLAWLPVFGVSVNLPSFPNIPASGSGSASASLSGAVLAGILIEKGNWFVDAEGLWAGLSAERTVAPTLTVDLDIVYGHGAVGRRIYKDVFLTGGVRRQALHYDIQLAEFPEFARKPGLWDPLVGLEWKHYVGEKWKLTASVDGGGFGVGSDVVSRAQSRPIGGSPATSAWLSGTVHCT